MTTEQVPKGWKVDHIVLIVVPTCSNHHHVQHHCKWRILFFIWKAGNSHWRVHLSSLYPTAWLPFGRSGHGQGFVGCCGGHDGADVEDDKVVTMCMMNHHWWCCRWNRHNIHIICLFRETEKRPTTIHFEEINRGNKSLYKANNSIFRDPGL